MFVIRTTPEYFEGDHFVAIKDGSEAEQAFFRVCQSIADSPEASAALYDVPHADTEYDAISAYLARRSDVRLIHIHCL